MTGVEFWGVTLDFVGKILIAVTAILTHRRLAIEKHIDKLVLKDLKLEFVVAIVGVLFLIAGYLINIGVLG